MSDLCVDQESKMKSFDFAQFRFPEYTIDLTPAHPEDLIEYDVYLNYMTLCVNNVVEVRLYEERTDRSLYTVTTTGILVERVKARDVIEAAAMGQAQAAIKKCKSLESEIKSWQGYYQEIKKQLEKQTARARVYEDLGLLGYIVNWLKKGW